MSKINQTDAKRRVSRDLDYLEATVSSISRTIKDGDNLNSTDLYQLLQRMNTAASAAASLTGSIGCLMAVTE